MILCRFLITLFVIGYFFVIECANAQTTEPLLQQGNLQYLGAFRVPQGWYGNSPHNPTFLNGGYALAYNPANNSLFLVNHPVDQLVAEISIPPLVNSASINALNVASVLQNPTDITEGNLWSVCPGCPLGVWMGGMVVVGNAVYGSAYAFYDGGFIANNSHWKSGTNLSISGDFKGIYQLGNFIAGNGGLVGGYMTQIPPEWQSLLQGDVLTGQCCISISARTSIGPSAFSFSSSNIGAQTPPISATALFYYTLSHPLNDNQSTNDRYNASTHIRGVVFPPGSRSVLYFGRQGTGPLCYGEQTLDPALNGTMSGTSTLCYDPADSSKGYHAFPYRHQIWAYDANDFVSVIQGTKNTYDVLPYAYWSFTLPFDDPNGMLNINGAAYDSVNKKIYISQEFVDNGLPVIHVFGVNLPSSNPTQPLGPSNLIVR